MKKFVQLPKLRKGDQVAIISPSSGLPGLFPWVQDLGLERLKTDFGLIPVEYPTTRQMGSTLKDRARDIEAAFSDPQNKAVITSIGGDDQIKLIKYLNPQIFLNNVKPFFGYSDNTHLCNFLWNLGIPSYYGGAVMTQFAMQEKMDAITVQSLHHALFASGEFELPTAATYSEEDLDWAVKANLTKERKKEQNGDWIWNATTDAEGILWGGCVESIIGQMSVGKYLPTEIDLENSILFLETAEDIPDHWILTYLLIGFGERGWLNKFQAILIGRPKTWALDKQYTTEQKIAYRQEQQEAVLQTVRDYNAAIPIIQNIDFGHTDPQLIIPMGQKARILSRSKKIFFSY